MPALFGKTVTDARKSYADYVRQVDGVQFGVNTAELSGPSRRQQICQARALISYLAVPELRISGADVARRMNDGEEMGSDHGERLTIKDVC